MKKIAEDLGITPAKASYLEEVISKNPDVKIEDIKDKSVREIEEVTKENTDKNEDATNKLEDTVFCNDRSTKAYDATTIGNPNMASYGSLGYGKNDTLFGTAHRASYWSKKLNPNLVCKNTNDKFTVDSKNGNGALTYPVGLITLDEVVLAGFNTYSSNTSDYKDTTNYLYTNIGYWTLSPIYTDVSGNASVNGVVNNDSIIHNKVFFIYGIRPVISLKSGTVVEPTGEGTTTKPYVVR